MKKSDSFIEFENPPSGEKLDRMTRAYFPWPGVWTRYNLSGKEVVIKFLPNQQIQVEGKRPLSYKDFMNGYKKGEEFLKKVGLS